MDNFLESQTNQTSALRVAANEDQFGEHRGLGMSEITFKVTPKDDDGIFIIEDTFHEKGGPARHCITIKTNGSTLLKRNTRTRGPGGEFQGS